MAWPSLGIKASYHEGRYGDLAGQLMFNLDIDGEKVVAIGFPDSFMGRGEETGYLAFSYIVHECFHQYQYNVFGEIPRAREEKYPISDFNNGALAWLEMCVLRDALEAIKADNREQCRRNVETFVAARRYRWLTGDPFIRGYEQGKELSEGTAKYVELKCVELFPGVDYISSLNGAASPLVSLFPDMSMPELLLHELLGKMGSVCLQPEDIPRNRIYAVAAIQDFLLDYFGFDWKAYAQQGGPGFTYLDLLSTHPGVDENQLEELVDNAKGEYDYEVILTATTQAARDYQLAYEHEIEAFEAQKGTPIEIVVSSSGLSRSRVCREKKWLVNDGLFLLCKNFDVYTLRGRAWTFELHDAGLLEINDWDVQLKTVVLYDAGVDSASFDGEPAIALFPDARKFESIEIKGERFVLKGKHRGSFISDRDNIRIILDSD